MRPCAVRTGMRRWWDSDRLMLPVSALVRTSLLVADASPSAASAGYHFCFMGFILFAYALPY
jgi:hypothetical protein